MESRWYLFEGQTLENTKIDDREHALHITSKAWTGIVRHLDRKKLIQEALDKEKEHRKALKEGSEAMTRNWDNSIENIRRRKEEGREKRLGFKDVDKLRKFYEMRKEQEAQREEFVRGVRRGVFRGQGYCRDVTSALITAETLHERQRQAEFNRYIREHEADEERKYAEKVKRDAEAEAEEKREKHRRQLEAKKELGEHLLQEVKELEAMKKADKEKRARQELEDFENATKEMEEKDRIEAEQKAERKAHMKEQQDLAFQREQEKRDVLMKEEKEMEEVIALYAETKHKIDCMKRQKELDLQRAQVERMKAIGKLATSDKEYRESVEKAFLEKAQAEKLAEEEQMWKKKHEFQERMKKERIEDRRQFLERKEKERQTEEEVKKWEMLNRYKTDEVYKDYDNERKSQHWQKILEYRKELLEQIEEDNEILRAQAEQERLEHEHEIEKNKKEDEMFFEYADEVIDLATKKGRTIYPLQKVVLGYKKAHNLIPNPGLQCIHKCEKYLNREEKNARKKGIVDDKQATPTKKDSSQCKCCKGSSQCKCCKKRVK